MVPRYALTSAHNICTFYQRIFVFICLGTLKGARTFRKCACMTSVYVDMTMCDSRRSKPIWIIVFVSSHGQTYCNRFLIVHWTERCECIVPSIPSPISSFPASLFSLPFSRTMPSYDHVRIIIISWEGEGEIGTPEGRMIYSFLSFLPYDSNCG